jgi:hypothetical protein
MHKDAQDIRSDRQDLRADRQDLRADRQDLRTDHSDLRQDYASNSKDAGRGWQDQHGSQSRWQDAHGQPVNPSMHPAEAKVGMTSATVANNAAENNKKAQTDQHLQKAWWHIW